MNIQFSSCQRNYVLDFLRKGYPNSVVSPEKLPKLMSGIERDIVRITDPAYQRLALVQGKKYKDSDEKEMREIAAEIQSLSTNSLLTKEETK